MVLYYRPADPDHLILHRVVGFDPDDPWYLDYVSRLRRLAKRILGPRLTAFLRRFS